jgi:xanthine dehydrogenase accessory factor
MSDEARAVYEALSKAAQEGIPSALATIIQTQGSMPRHTGSKMLVYGDGQIVGTIGGGAMESQVIAVAKDVIATGQARSESYTLNSLEAGDPGICGGTALIFIEAVAIAPSLLVIGGGHVGKALAELGKWLGYRVLLSDDRPEYCNESYVAGLDDYVVCKPGEISERVVINKQTYIAAVTRGLPVDEKLIPALLKTEAAFIGLIGSRRRWAITAKKLQLNEKELIRIHAPIGLELEAETPNEIALSIMAEITMLRRGGTGQPMQWSGHVDEAD